MEQNLFKELQERKQHRHTPDFTLGCRSSQGRGKRCGLRPAGKIPDRSLQRNS